MLSTMCVSKKRNIFSKTQRTRQKKLPGATANPNTKYFFVVFKKLEGVTPNQFRKTNEL